MKILITGGTGFQGSNLSKSLLEDGHDVVILNLHSKKNGMSPLMIKANRKILLFGREPGRKRRQHEFR